MTIKTLSQFVAASFCFVISICSAAPVVLTGLDIASMSSVSGLTLSADGKRVAYVRTTHSYDEAAKFAEDDDKAGWTVEDQVWVVEVAAGIPRQVTFGPDKASQPQFSPDGTLLAFMREKDKHRKLHVLNMSGGEAQIVDTRMHEPGTYAWSPDGKRICIYR